jgi:hypothetical protein
MRRTLISGAVLRERIFDIMSLRFRGLTISITLMPLIVAMRRVHLVALSCIRLNDAPVVSVQGIGVCLAGTPSRALRILCKYSFLATANYA